MTFHFLRHTYDSTLHDNGASPFEMQALMRHKSLAMTGHYSQPSKAAKRAAVSKLPDPNRCETAAPGQLQ